MTDRLSKAAYTVRMLEIVDFFRDLGSFKFVGGCVRDLLLDVTPKDYDLITPCTPEVVEEYIRSKGRRVFKVGARFGTLGVKLNGEMIEITTYRGEDYVDETRKPQVRWTEHLDEDLARRDFTINAIALDAYSGKLHDPFNGVADLQARIVRAVGNPKVRFKEDPLRILRAVRFATRLNATIEEKTFEKANHCRFELFRVSKERIVQEINAMFRLSNPSDAMALMWDLDLWQVVAPEMHLQKGYDQRNPHHAFTLEGHTLTAMELAAEWLDQNPELPRERHLWAVLLHDIGKPFTAAEKPGVPGHFRYIDHDRVGAEIVDRFMRFYKFSNDDREFVVGAVKDHLKDDHWMRSFDNGAKG
jgi:putative nucleotidyltransferase with HDIG domain